MILIFRKGVAESVLESYKNNTSLCSSNPYVSESSSDCEIPRLSSVNQTHVTPVKTELNIETSCGNYDVKKPKVLSNPINQTLVSPVTTTRLSNNFSESQCNSNSLNVDISHSESESISNSSPNDITSVQMRRRRPAKKLNVSMVW